MFNKIEILIIIFILLLAFYLVIWLGAGGTKKSTVKLEISKYLFGVRILISIIGIVSIILWIFL